MNISKSKLQAKRDELRKLWEGAYEKDEAMILSVRSAVLNDLLQCMEEPACIRCNTPFQPHHHRHVTQKGIYHTSCYKKEPASEGTKKNHFCHNACPPGCWLAGKPASECGVDHVTVGSTVTGKCSVCNTYLGKTASECACTCPGLINRIHQPDCPCKPASECSHEWGIMCVKCDEPPDVSNNCIESVQVRQMGTTTALPGPAAELYICPSCGTEYVRETPCGGIPCRDMNPVPIAKKIEAAYTMAPEAMEKIDGERLESIKQRLKDYDDPNFPDEDVKGGRDSAVKDIRFLLSHIDRLEAENTHFKDALEKITKANCCQECSKTDGVRILRDIARHALTPDKL